MSPWFPYSPKGEEGLCWTGLCPSSYKVTTGPELRNSLCYSESSTDKSKPTLEWAIFITHGQLFNLKFFHTLVQFVCSSVVQFLSWAMSFPFGSAYGPKGPGLCPENQNKLYFKGKKILKC
jgi:hypothetical protein